MSAANECTYAESVAGRSDEVALKPMSISRIEAGTLPLAGITAWNPVVTFGAVAEGRRVLVHAASESAGSLAVQIAKSRKACVI